MSDMTEAEFEGRLAELLFGCREDGSREEIVGRVSSLVELERAVTLKGNKGKILFAFQEFMNRLEELSTP